MKAVFAFTRRHIGWLILGMIFVVTGVSASMFPPTLARRVVDEIFIPAANGTPGGGPDLLLLLVLGIAAATIIRAGSILAKSLALETFSQRVLRDIRRKLYDHIQELSFAFFHKTRTGELMARMTGDMEAVRMFLVVGFMHGATGLLYFTFSASILFSIDWRLALFAVAGSPFLFIFTFALRKRISPKFRAMREQYSDLNTAVQENISGIRVVKALMRYDYELEKFRKENRGLSDSRNAALVVWARYMPVIEFLSGIASALILVAGGWMVIREIITVGVWVQFNGYLWMLVMPMRMLGEVVNSYSLASASADRIREVLETDAHIKNAPNPILPKGAMNGEIEFRNVSWRVDGQTILSDIDIRAAAGSTIAIMGATGSGKSSLIHLIPRFYDPDEGAVLIDGIDIRELDVNYLRSNVGLVAQETFLFSESMYNNLTFGRRGVSSEFVKQVAVQTQAHEFIRSMSDGYGTVVGERGVGLSGGQKQRASIARTLLKEAPILILDDATSAVDMETEMLIQRALRKLEHKATKFVIAHRISAIKHADEIIILDHGRIAERGTHDELLSAGNHYAEIYDVQYRGM